MTNTGNPVMKYLTNRQQTSYPYFIIITQQIQKQATLCNLSPNTFYRIGIKQTLWTKRAKAKIKCRHLSLRHTSKSTTDTSTRGVSHHEEILFTPPPFHGCCSLLCCICRGGRWHWCITTCQCKHSGNDACMEALAVPPHHHMLKDKCSIPAHNKINVEYKHDYL